MLFGPDIFMMYASGTHVLLDFYGCSYLTDANRLEKIMRAASLASGAQVLETRFYTFPGRAGVTGVVLLAESHMSIHTWPEHDFAALDIFMCGECSPELAVAHLTEALRPVEVRNQTIARGVASGTSSPSRPDSIPPTDAQ